jgi:hypothetical protein
MSAFGGQSGHRLAVLMSCGVSKERLAGPESQSKIPMVPSTIAHEPAAMVAAASRAIGRGLVPALFFVAKGAVSMISN